VNNVDMMEGEVVGGAEKLCVGDGMRECMLGRGWRMYVGRRLERENNHSEQSNVLALYLHFIISYPDNYRRSHETCAPVLNYSTSLTPPEKHSNHF
jgi:hypothetical protein